MFLIEAVYVQRPEVSVQQRICPQGRGILTFINSDFFANHFSSMSLLVILKYATSTIFTYNQSEKNLILFEAAQDPMLGS